jgi:putative tricarboxylic transport membrane protein
MTALGIGLAALATGAAAIAGSLVLTVGTPATPGAGFFPLVAASLVVMAATVVLVQERRVPDPASEGRVDVSWLPIVVGAMWMGALLLEHAGFVLAAALVALVLMRALGMAWRNAGALALAMSTALYVLFHRALRIDLPAGLLGFLG